MKTLVFLLSLVAGLSLSVNHNGPLSSQGRPLLNKSDLAFARNLIMLDSAAGLNIRSKQSQPLAGEIKKSARKPKRRALKMIKRSKKTSPRVLAKGDKLKEVGVKLDPFGKEIVKGAPEELECNRNILEAFGISTTDDLKPLQSALPITDNLCMRNKMTCCSENDIQATKATFKQGKLKLGENIDVLEELFNLFKGRLHKQVIFRLQRHEQCKTTVGQMGTFKDAADFFNLDHINFEVREIEGILLNIRNFKKQQLWFYGNIICTICNPKDSSYFTIMNERSKFKVDMRTCSDLIGLIYLELRIRKIIRDFMIPLAMFIQCSQENYDDTFEGSGIIDTAIEEAEAQTNNCMENFDPDNPACLQACRKELSFYDFPGNVFSNARKVLRILFKEFTKTEISEYYKSVKEKTWIDEDVTTAEFFDPKNASFKSHKVAQIEWILTKDGVHVFNNIMNKKYFFSQSTWKSAITLAGVLVAWLLI